MIGLTPCLEVPGLITGSTQILVDPLVAHAGCLVLSLQNRVRILLYCRMSNIRFTIDEPYGDLIVDHSLQFICCPLLQRAVLQSSIYFCLIGMIAKVTIVLYECRYQVRTLTNQIGYYEGTVRVAHANDLILIYIVICDEVIQNTSYFLRCYYFTCVVNIHTQDNCFRICFCPAGHHVIK